jgi:carboxypeptidase C (cathepsin A)
MNACVAIGRLEVHIGDTRSFVTANRTGARQLPRAANARIGGDSLMKKNGAIILSLTLVSLGVFPAATVRSEEKTAIEEGSSSPVVQSERFTSEHRITIGGRIVEYTATAGTMVMKNDKEEPVALFGYTAYVEKGADPAARPILFAYNGGPGSASIWLHMGILGPQRVVLDDVEFTPPGPFRRITNEYSILDEADLVMIDPVGTGYSKPVGEAEGKDFWGVDQDIASVSDFIARYITENGRWLSPKYLLGESYGGMRSAGVTYRLLATHGLALNGLILVSPYLDFVAGNTGIGIDLANVLYFTTYAATAWYHQTIPDRPADLRAFLDQAEQFAESVYAPALFKGHRLSESARQNVLAGLARFTGISEDYWDRANLRLDEGQFPKEVLRNRRETSGRTDTRFKGKGVNHIAERYTYDPFDSAVGPAFAAAFHDYYRQDLGVVIDRDYVVSAKLWENWDESHKSPKRIMWWDKLPFANTAIDLTHAMVQNPNMRVLVQQGYFDLATPYGVTEYVLDHMELDLELRRNITVKYYEAGHMMYVHPVSMVSFKEDLAEFIE